MKHLIPSLTKIISLILLGMLWPHSGLMAQETPNGTGSRWDLAGTWTSGTVPNSGTTDVTITTGNTIDLFGGQSFTVRNLIVENGATLIQSGSLTVTGTVVVEAGGIYRQGGFLEFATSFTNFGEYALIAGNGAGGTIASTGTGTMSNESGATFNISPFNPSAVFAELEVPITNKAGGTVNVSARTISATNKTLTNEGTYNQTALFTAVMIDNEATGVMNIGETSGVGARVLLSNVDNAGTLNVLTPTGTSSNTLIFDDPLSTNGIHFINSGIINVQDDAKLELTLGTYDFTDGTLQGNGLLDFKGTCSIMADDANGFNLAIDSVILFRQTISGVDGPTLGAPKLTIESSCKFEVLDVAGITRFASIENDGDFNWFISVTNNFEKAFGQNIVNRGVMNMGGAEVIDSTTNGDLLLINEVGGVLNCEAFAGDFQPDFLNRGTWNQHNGEVRINQITNEAGATINVGPTGAIRWGNNTLPNMTSKNAGTIKLDGTITFLNGSYDFTGGKLTSTFNAGTQTWSGVINFSQQDITITNPNGFRPEVGTMTMTGPNNQVIRGTAGSCFTIPFGSTFNWDRNGELLGFGSVNNAGTMNLIAPSSLFIKVIGSDLVNDVTGRISINLSRTRLVDATGTTNQVLNAPGGTIVDQNNNPLTTTMGASGIPIVAAASVCDLTICGTTNKAFAVQNGNWNDPATWGGILPSTNNSASIPSGITVTVQAGQSFNVRSIEVDGTLNIDGNLTTTCAFTIGATGTVNQTGVLTNNGPSDFVNNGTYQLAPGAGTAGTLAGVNLDNQGQLTIVAGAASTAAKINVNVANNGPATLSGDVSSTNTFTNSTGQTINYAGGTFGMNMVNNGTINANGGTGFANLNNNAGATLAIPSGQSLALGTTITNAGAINVEGTLNMNAGSYDMSNGTLSGSGTLNIDGAVNISSTSGFTVGVTTVNQTSGTLSGVANPAMTINAGVTYDAQAGTAIQNFSLLTNQGDLDVANPDAAFTVPIDNEGTLDLTAGTLTLSALTNSGTTAIASGATLNPGTFDNQSGGNTDITSGATLNLETTVSNAGTLTADGTLNMNAGSYDMSNGTLSGSGTLNIDGAVNVSSTSGFTVGVTTVNQTGGTLSGVANPAMTINAGVTYDAQAGTAIQNFSLLTNQGDLDIASPDAAFTVAIDNEGTLDLTAGTLSPSALTNSGTTAIASGATLSPGTFDNQSGGNTDISSGATLNLETTVSNAGTLTADGTLNLNAGTYAISSDIMGTGTMNISGTVNVNSTTGFSLAVTTVNQTGGTLSLTGASNPLTVNSGITFSLSGTASVQGFSNIDNNGTLNASNLSNPLTVPVVNGQTVNLNAGTLSLTSLTNEATGIVEVNSGTTLSLGDDAATIAPDMNLEGTINVSGTGVLALKQGTYHVATGPINGVDIGGNKGTLNFSTTQTVTINASPASGFGEFTPSVGNITVDGGSTVAGDANTCFRILTGTTATWPNTAIINGFAALYNEGTLNLDGGTGSRALAFNLFNLATGTLNFNDPTATSLGGSEVLNVGGTITGSVQPTIRSIASAPACGTAPPPIPGSFTTVSTGTWNDPNIWATGTVPSAADPVTIRNVVSILPGENVSSANLTIQQAGSITLPPTAGLTVNGDMDNAGAFDNAGGALTVIGNLNTTNALTNRSVGVITVTGNLVNDGVVTITDESVLKGSATSTITNQRNSSFLIRVKGGTSPVIHSFNKFNNLGAIDLDQNGTGLNLMYWYVNTVNGDPTSLPNCDAAIINITDVAMSLNGFTLDNYGTVQVNSNLNVALLGFTAGQYFNSTVVSLTPTGVAIGSSTQGLTNYSACSIEKTGTGPGVVEAVNNTATGAIRIEEGGSLQINQLTNAGLIEVDGELVLSGAQLTNSGGELTGPGTLIFSGTNTISGDFGPTIDSLSFISGTLNPVGATSFTVQANSTLEWSGNASFGAFSTFTNFGTIYATAPTGSFSKVIESDIQNESEAVFNVVAGDLSAPGFTFFNRGRLDFAGAVPLTFDMFIQNEANSEFVQCGANQPTLPQGFVLDPDAAIGAGPGANLTLTEEEIPNSLDIAAGATVTLAPQNGAEPVLTAQEHTVAGEIQASLPVNIRPKDPTQPTTIKGGGKWPDVNFDAPGNVDVEDDTEFDRIALKRGKMVLKKRKKIKAFDITEADRNKYIVTKRSASVQQPLEAASKQFPIGPDEQTYTPVALTKSLSSTEPETGFEVGVQFDSQALTEAETERDELSAEIALKQEDINDLDDLLTDKNAEIDSLRALADSLDQIIDSLDDLITDKQDSLTLAGVYAEFVDSLTTIRALSRVALKRASFQERSIRRNQIFLSRCQAELTSLQADLATTIAEIDELQARKPVDPTMASDLVYNIDRTAGNASTELVFNISTSVALLNTPLNNPSVYASHYEEVLRKRWEAIKQTEVTSTTTDVMIKVPDWNDFSPFGFGIGNGLATPDTTTLSALTCDPNLVGSVENLLVNSIGADSLLITTTALDDPSICNPTGGCNVAISQIGQVDETCAQAFDGKLTIIAAGAANLEYSKDGGLTWQASHVFEKLSPGPYQIVVRDTQDPSCLSGVMTKTIMPGLPLPTWSSKVTHASCLGTTDGSIELIASTSATGPFMYSLDGVSFVAGGNKQTFANIGAGDYPVLIKDGNGCVSAIRNATVKSNVRPMFKLHGLTDATNSTAHDGKFRIVPRAGRKPFMYSLDGGNTFIAGGNNYTATGLAAGTYSVVIKDSRGCVSEDRAYVVNDMTKCPSRSTLNRVFKANASRDNAITRNVCEGNSFEYLYQVRSLGSGQHLRLDWAIEETTGKVNQGTRYNGMVPTPDFITGSEGPHANGKYTFDANGGILDLEELAQRQDEIFFSFMPMLILSNGQECASTPSDVTALVYPEAIAMVDNATQPGQTIAIPSGSDPNGTVSIKTPVLFNERNNKLVYSLHIAPTPGIAELGTAVNVSDFGNNTKNGDFDGFDALAAVGINAFTNTTADPINVTVKITPKSIPTRSRTTPCPGPMQTIDIWVLPTNSNIRAAERVAYEIFPNPAQDFIQIETSAPLASSQSVEISDLRGQVVLQTVIAPLETTSRLSVSTLPAGMYIIRIAQSEGIVLTEKLIIE